MRLMFYFTSIVIFSAGTLMVGTVINSGRGTLSTTRIMRRSIAKCFDDCRFAEIDDFGSVSPDVLPGDVRCFVV